jgi:hypothetical protein
MRMIRPYRPMALLPFFLCPLCAPAEESTPASPLPPLVVEVRRADENTSTTPAPATPVPGEVRALQSEVAALRGDLRQLQETLNLLINQIMSDLELENAQLRAELQRLYERDAQGLLQGHTIPKPGGEAIQRILEEQAARTPAEGEQTGEGPAAKKDAPKPLPPADFTVEIISEWGRSKEVAEKLPGHVPTLIGQVLLVPEGSLRADLEQLGRDLRVKYNDYDNINVEVFDDPAAAQIFAETHIADPDHRVLSISKHEASGRDVILYMDRGASFTVPFVPAAVPPSGSKP